MSGRQLPRQTRNLRTVLNVRTIEKPYLELRYFGASQIGSRQTSAVVEIDGSQAKVAQNHNCRIQQGRPGLEFPRFALARPTISDTRQLVRHSEFAVRRTGWHVT
jgi:hypothetical protein